MHTYAHIITCVGCNATKTTKENPTFENTTIQMKSFVPIEIVDNSTATSLKITPKKRNEMDTTTKINFE